MNLCSRISAAVALLATALTPSLALADTTFGTEGQVIVSAERMFGYSVASAKFKPDVDNATTTRVTNNSLTLLGTSPLIGGFGDLDLNFPNPYLAPTLGVHYTFLPSLTLGGNLGFSHSSGDYETKGGNTTTKVEGDPLNMLIFSPKIGYVLGLTPQISLWLRGGLTLYHFWGGSDDDNRTSFSGTGFGLNIDPMLVFSPADHVGITLGPNIDLPLTGGLTTETKSGNTTVSRDYDLTFRNFGVTLGLLTNF